MSIFSSNDVMECLFVYLIDSNNIEFKYELKEGDIITWEFDENEIIDFLKSTIHKSKIEIIDYKEKCCCVYCSYGQDKIPYFQITSVNGIKTKTN